MNIFSLLFGQCRQMIIICESGLHMADGIPQDGAPLCRAVVLMAAAKAGQRAGLHTEPLQRLHCLLVVHRCEHINILPFSRPHGNAPALCRAPGSSRTPAKQKEAGGAGNPHPAEGRSIIATHKAVFLSVPDPLCNGRLFYGLLSTPQAPARSWDTGSGHLVF